MLRDPNVSSSRSRVPLAFGAFFVGIMCLLGEIVTSRLTGAFAGLSHQFWSGFLIGIEIVSFAAALVLFGSEVWAKRR